MGYDHTYIHSFILIENVDRGEQKVSSRDGFASWLQLQREHNFFSTSFMLSSLLTVKTLKTQAAQESRFLLSHCGISVAPTSEKIETYRLYNEDH